MFKNWRTYSLQSSVEFNSDSGSLIPNVMKYSGRCFRQLQITGSENRVTFNDI